MNDKALELWQRLAMAINEETINDGGTLARNNHRIWRGYLHKWTNKEWFAIYGLLADLQEQHPELFRKDQTKALARALNILVAEHTVNQRCLDTAENKSAYWQMIMVMRELWNSANKAQPADIFTIED
jgi:hypothetical protein